MHTVLPVTQNWATRGGVFFGQDDTNTTLADCTATFNQAANGAVSYLLGDITANGRPFFLVDSSVFSGNSAQFGGVTYGAVSTFSTLDDCQFFNNSVTASGGVAYYSGQSTVAMGECQAWNNVAAFDGGIIYGSDGSKVSIWRSTFNSSHAKRGGAFFGTDEAWFRITSSSITLNRGTMGGAIHLDGVPYATINSQMNITMSVLSDNDAIENGVGGAAYISGTCLLRLSQCNASHNTAHFGGVVYSRDDGLVRRSQSLSLSLAGAHPMLA